MKHDDGAVPPEVAAALFGDRLPMAQRYAELLRSEAVERGLIGPRETERIWDRHILNSAAVAEQISDGTRVADIGSGAGLPGIPLAIARPDLSLTLIEPMLRRTAFLDLVVTELELTSVEVSQHRAEERIVRDRAGFDYVTSRAVASLDKLARWSLPLLKVGGSMLALKGERAPAELEEYGQELAGLGAVDVKVMRCGVEYLDPPVTVVVARRGAEPKRRERGSSSRRGR